MLDKQYFKTEFKIPKDVDDRRKNLKKTLSYVEGKYSSIIGKSIKKRLIRKIKFNKEINKSNLEKELKKIKEELNILYSTYYYDKNFRRKVENQIDKVNTICAEADIKSLKNVKIDLKKYPFLGDLIKEKLKTIENKNELLDKKIKDIKQINNTLKGNNTFIEDFSSKKKPLKQKIKEGEKYGINVSEEKKLVIIKLGEKNSQKGKYDEVLKKFEKEETEWKNSLETYAKIENFKIKIGVLSRLILKMDSFLEEINKLGKIECTSETKIDGELLKKIESATKKLEEKIEFAKKLEEYVVFDNNMGVKIEHARKSLNEIKTAGSYGNYINCESQNCLKIAKGEKRMEEQYNHKNGDTKDLLGMVSYKGPYYIIVDKSGKQVSEAYTSGAVSSTINSSTDQPKAENEVQNYLKHALQEGKFMQDKKWLEPYK